MTTPQAVYLTMLCTIVGCIGLIILVSWWTDREMQRHMPAPKSWMGRSYREFTAYIHKTMPEAEVCKNGISGQVIIYTEYMSDHGTLKPLVLE